MKKVYLLVLASGVSSMAFSAGFALYEGSARGNALGGGVMGKAVDASANFYNPATLSDFTNTVVTIGMTTEHPTADTSVNGRSEYKMDPGCFILPHAYVAQPLPYGFTLGLGVAPEYGLGTHYNKNWSMVWDTRETTIEGIAFNPNLSYAVTEDWSVSAGIRLMYFSFDQYSDQMAVSDGYNYGTIHDHLKGDNGMTDWGWQLSSRYKITEKLSAGIMYKSFIDCKVKGHNHARVNRYDDSAIGPQVQKGVEAALASAGVPVGTPMYNALYQQYYSQAYGEAVQKAHSQVDQGAASANGTASAKVRLPQSLTMGLNYDVMDDLHLGTALTWTQWSCMEGINFNLPGNHDKTVLLKWNDVWRAGFGAAYDLTENFTLMGSYVFDQDPCRKYHGTSMLPPGNRHIMTFGLGYTWGNLDISTSYGLVFMDGDPLYLSDATGAYYKLETSKGLSHAVAVTVSYRF
jgi:long-chain fatty acid transport protein